ncbi:MAG TPA: AMP-binding protein, partial [Propionicimonas sp.]|nr:AMP-binding protein [Propionicimonas sp.]
MADIASNTTTAGLWNAAGRRFGDRVFLVHLDADGGRVEFGYAQFARLIHQAAHAFRSVGVAPGDAVLLQLHNRPETLMALFGLAEIGAIAVPLNRDATPSELLQAYRACGARWAVVEDCLLDVHRRLRAEEGVAIQGLLGVSDFAALGSRQPDDPITDVVLTDLTVAELLYTSGTTAAP